MATRAFWKGYLKVALVNCPVAMSTAAGEDEKLRFHTINRETGDRVVSQFIDSVTGEPVAEKDEVKGYPIGEDQFVILEDKELRAVALESTRTLEVDCFVPRESIGWIWLDQPHYLVPDDKVGEEAFAVIRAAMAATGTVGIARLVLYRRERAVMLEPSGKGIVVWTLRAGEEVRPEADYFPKPGRGEPDGDLLGMFGELIEARRRPWSEEMVQDPVEARLAEIVAAREKAAKKPSRSGGKKKSKAAPGDNVVPIFEALKQSIAAEKKR